MLLLSHVLLKLKVGSSPELAPTACHMHLLETISLQHSAAQRASITVSSRLCKSTCHKYTHASFAFTNSAPLVVVPVHMGSDGR